MKGKPWSVGNKSAPPIKHYRCLYCRKRFSDRTKLPGHEAQCSMRETVRRSLVLAVTRGKSKLGLVKV